MPRKFRLSNKKYGIAARKMKKPEEQSICTTKSFTQTEHVSTCEVEVQTEQLSTEPCDMRTMCLPNIYNIHTLYHQI